MRLRRAACALRTMKPREGVLQGVDLGDWAGVGCPAEAKPPELNAQEEWIPRREAAWLKRLQVNQGQG